MLLTLHFFRALGKTAARLNGFLGHFISWFFCIGSAGVPCDINSLQATDWAGSGVAGLVMRVTQLLESNLSFLKPGSSAIIISGSKVNGYTQTHHSQLANNLNIIKASRAEMEKLQYSWNCWVWTCWQCWQNSQEHWRATLVIALADKCNHEGCLNR